MPEFLPFLGVAVVLVITPGPDMALITRNALLHGRRAALLTALGVNAGLMGWTIAAALGIATVVRSSAVAFETLRFLGALYLVFLGVQAIISSISRPGTAPLTSAPSRRPLADGAAVRQGLLSNLLNPKIAIFFSSFLPQFMTPTSSILAQSLVLGTVFVLLGLVWLSAYALLATRAGGVFSRPLVRTAIQRLTGGVLIAFGIRLAPDQR